MRCRKDERWGSHENENVPHNPKIIRPMPRPPEPKRRIIIRHTTDHVLRWVDPVQERPEAEETPGKEELFFRWVWCVRQRLDEQRRWACVPSEHSKETKIKVPNKETGQMKTSKDW